MCIFNRKFCVELFICEYTLMYDVRYPISALERVVDSTHIL